MAFVNRRFILFAVLLGGLLFGTTTGYPMVTDDAGTMGRGKGQIELDLELSYDKTAKDGEDPTRSEAGEASLTATYGLGKNLDIVVELPYQWQSAYVSGQLLARNDGLADVNLDLKWCFFEKDGWGFALKPGLSLPAGNDEKGLGGGRTAYRLYFITTRELEPWAFHLNLGYHRNENNAGNRADIWHVSAAAELKLARDFKVGVDLGMERNPVPSKSDHPAFALAEGTYDLSERLSLEADVKFGLTKPEKDVTYLLSLTYKF